MKFTLNWLKESVEFTGTADELAKLLTMAGLEVESVTPLREPESDRADQLFEVGVTPNRGDCLGIAGIAREVAALTGARVNSAPVSAVKKTSAIGKRVTLTIENSELRPRYSARIVDNRPVAPATVGMGFRLEACGIRSI